MKLKDAIKELEFKLLKCEECGAEFPQEDIVLFPIDMKINFHQHTQVLTFIYISKDENGYYKFYGGANPPNVGDLVGTCPKCRHIHYFGF